MSVSLLKSASPDKSGAPEKSAKLPVIICGHCFTQHKSVGCALGWKPTIREEH